MNETEIHRQKVEEALGILRGRIREIPQVILVLGTGLGALAEKIEVPFLIPYEDIPGFPGSTMIGHAGNLILGRLSGVSVAALQGRFHYYEGYSMKEITIPVRVLSLLGAETMIVTNASGGLNPDFTTGTFMIISDHLNFMGENPLKGPNNDHWGPRFPDMSETYDGKLIATALECAARLKLDNVKTGVYAALPGPSLETPAELRLIKNSGADSVGMSTVPEVIVARHAGLKVLGISVITNMNDLDNPKPVFIEEVSKSAEAASTAFESLIACVLNEL
ncbi:MAG: purine-nucleoside phosphorylase [Thermodesulfobacteriota bacterium]|nr:purine-nucleoside phosphorylase [Thermodesulfobacteriota bacterium]